MLLVFYILLILLVIFTLCTILQSNTMYSLFYFCVSILITSLIFFLLGNDFIGCFHIIIYSGAILVFFIFIIMLFNLDEYNFKKYNIKNYFCNFLYFLLFVLIFLLFLRIFFYCNNMYISYMNQNLKSIGMVLFEPYLLVIELLSVLLLSSLITVFLISKGEHVLKNIVYKNKEI